MTHRSLIDLVSWVSDKNPKQEKQRGKHLNRSKLHVLGHGEYTACGIDINGSLSDPQERVQTHDVHNYVIIGVPPGEMCRNCLRFTGYRVE